MVDSDATCARSTLGQAAASLRSAEREDAVLEVLAHAARTIAGVPRAWCGRVSRIGFALECLSASEEALNGVAAEPSFDALLAIARAGPRSVVRDEARGFIAFALLGPGDSIEGLLVLAWRPPAPETLAAGIHAEYIATCSQLSVLVDLGGVALEAARLRAAVDVVTRGREVLLAHIAHDLRNPLNTFTMSAGLLRDDLERGDVDVARGTSLISRMERASSRMQNLIEDLLEASRVDAGKVSYVFREESSIGLVDEAVAAANATRAALGKPPNAAHDESADEAVVKADRKRALQAFSKILIFASKYAGESGSIRVARSRENKVVRFTVSALGSSGAPIGMPEPNDFGLPLLLARGLIEAQGGRFHEAAGGDFRIAFTLPLVGL